MAVVQWLKDTVQDVVSSVFSSTRVSPAFRMVGGSLHSVWCVWNSSKPSRASLPSGHSPLGRSCSRAEEEEEDKKKSSSEAVTADPRQHDMLNQQHFTPAAAEHDSILASETPSSPQSAAPPPPEQVLVTRWFPLKGTSVKIKERFDQTNTS